MNNEFHYMYPTNQFGSMPMAASLGGYSTGGSTPGLMGTPADHHQISMMQQYAHTPAFSKPSPAPASSMTFSTRIIGDQNSIVYYHDEQNNSFNEHNVRQMITADGAVFVEHIAGYSLVYVPNIRPIEQVLGGAGSHTNARASHGASNKGAAKSQNGGAPRERSAKPSNAFIMYRNFKIKEMRENNPEINQIEISRMAGDLWKEECDEVKNEFREKYRQQKLEYDLKKNTNKRPRSDTLGQVHSDDDTLSVSSESSKRRKNSIPNNLGFGNGSAGGKPRSRTMPSAVLASSASRVDYAADLRKHVAARNGSAFLNSSPFESSDLQLAYAELSDSTNINNSPIPTIMNGSTYMQGDMTTLNLDGVQPFSVGSMSVAEQEAIYASQHAAMTTGVDPSTLGSSDHTDLAHSFINAGIAAGISTMDDTQGLVIGTDVGDIAAAASIATSNFYNSTTTPLVAHPADVQWDQTTEHISYTEADASVNLTAAVDTSNSTDQ
ncbi:hypothetical protein EV176_001931 [Coemansia sp. RSA 451]|nr:hypothetical protein EV176_001931 [Coemansia sp. RSA 451]